MTPLRTLVITPSPGISGAPIALLRIMRWCIANDALDPTFVLRGTDPLTPAFRALGPVLVAPETAEWRVRHALARIAPGSRSLDPVGVASGYRVRRLSRLRASEVIYCNTATQGQLISRLRRIGLPIVTHVHELERLLLATLGVNGIKAVIDNSDMLLAVSDPVRTMLESYGAPPDRITDVPEPVGEEPLLDAAGRNVVRRDVFGVTPDTCLVVASGHPSVRKGTDVFLQVVRHVVSHLDDATGVAFRWLGGKPTNDLLIGLRDDASRMGLSGHVAAVEQRSDAATVIGAADILISTSREDPNPLVVLEAAAAGLPVVCFRGAGGAEDLANRGAALAVPYLDAAAMGWAILSLARDPSERARLGAAAQSQVMAHNTPAAVGSKVAEVLRLVRAGS